MPPPVTPRDFTLCLAEWRRGDKQALDRIVPVVYSELRRIASSYMKKERSGHTLQPTALIHEAYLRLVDQNMPEFRGRTHFFGVAAQLMRQILVDRAREFRSEKRGGGRKISIDQIAEPASSNAVDLILLDAALTKLAGLDPAKARALELQYFAGLTVDEIAEALESSPRTMARELRSARAFLLRELS